MGNYLSPGVYVRETDFSFYVKQISTAAAAMVGVAERGPINKVGLVTSTNNPSLAAGIVISATPTPGATVAKDSTVSLLVATGRVILINYVGFTVDAAKAQLEGPDSQLVVTTQEDVNCTAQTPAVVSQQSLAPGEAPVHAEITLTYCSGP